MDKEQAKFILRSFRPDGSDIHDADFADALTLAMENRELGEWLASERAFDAGFANALAAVELPDKLRMSVLACLASDLADFPQAEDHLDASFIGALATIQPAASMRAEILAAMDRTTASARQKKPLWRHFSMPIAAAAGIALAIFLTRDRQPEKTALAGPLPVDVVQAGFIRTFESPLFSLDEKRSDQKALLDVLRSKKLPCPGCLPPGLAHLKAVGCRELVIDGKSGSLLCFDEGENGVVHLVIFHREDICGDLPCCKHPSYAQKGRWAAARWEDENHVFILIGNTDVEKLSNLF